MGEVSHAPKTFVCQGIPDNTKELEVSFSVRHQDKEEEESRVSQISTQADLSLIETVETRVSP